MEDFFSCLIIIAGLYTLITLAAVVIPHFLEQRGWKRLQGEPGMFRFRKDNNG